jgi:uncharacterized protein YndB with AHSA1/START domain
MSSCKRFDINTLRKPGAVLPTTLRPNRGTGGTTRPVADQQGSASALLRHGSASAASATHRRLLRCPLTMRGVADMAGPTFEPKTVYVIYIAASPEKAWAALTRPEFTQQYFFGRTIEIAPKEGGSFILRMPDGKVDVKGRVVEWNPPRRLSVTWAVDWIAEMRGLPECLVTYDIDPAGQSVKLTMTEAHQWDVPEDLLSGGRAGWPAILSSLKSVLETGKPLSIEMQPPKEMLAALHRLKGK